MIEYGFLKIDKKENYTSKDCDSIVKKKLNRKKVGHLGTLDPFATGLLIVAIGDATKALPLIKDEEKTYMATLKLGKETDTLDKTGEIIKTKEVPTLSKEEIQDILSSFLGKSKQIPPLFSAKHVNGVRAYHRARNNEDFTLNPIDIEIFDIKLLDYDAINNILVFEATVSKGTYLRSLGRDIAYRLNTVGMLLALRRTRIGSITLEDALPLEAVEESRILSLSSLLPFIPLYQLTKKELPYVKNGNKIHQHQYQDPYIFMIYEEKILAIYQKEKDTLYRCLRGFVHD